MIMDKNRNANFFIYGKSRPTKQMIDLDKLIKDFLD